MKVIISILLVAFFNNNDPFFKAVKELEKINYFIKKSDCTNIDKSTSACFIKPQQHCLINQIYDQAKKNNSSQVNAINYFNKDLGMNIAYKIDVIKDFFVKSTVAMGSNTYGRAHIQEWKCKSMEDAKLVELALSTFDIEGNYECTNKSPIAWWRKNDKIYYITIGGHYMIEDLLKLEKQLKSSL